MGASWESSKFIYRIIAPLNSPSEVPLYEIPVIVLTYDPKYILIMRCKVVILRLYINYIIKYNLQL